MLKVDIHGLDDNAEPLKLGEIWTDGERLGTTVTHPRGTNVLANIIARPIRGQGGVTIHPTDPVAFVNNLWCYYRSPYQMASEAREE